MLQKEFLRPGSLCVQTTISNVLSTERNTGPSGHPLIGSQNLTRSETIRRLMSSPDRLWIIQELLGLTVHWRKSKPFMRFYPWSSDEVDIYRHDPLFLLFSITMPRMKVLVQFQLLTLAKSQRVDVSKLTYCIGWMSLFQKHCMTSHTFIYTRSPLDTEGQISSPEQSILSI